MRKHCRGLRGGTLFYNSTKLLVTPCMLCGASIDYCKLRFRLFRGLFSHILNFGGGMRKLLTTAILLIIFSAFGCDIEELARDLWEYVVEGKSWSSGDGHEPSNDGSWDFGDFTWPVERCDGIYVQVSATGYAMDTACLWATIERHDQILSYSRGLSIDSGDFGGFYLSIPLDGLSLDDDPYEINLYISSDTTGVGDQTSSLGRTIDAYPRTFSAPLREKIASRERPSLSKGWGDGAYCVPGTSTMDFTVSYHDNYTEMRIVEGYNENNAIEWWVGGPMYYAGTVSSDGRFTGVSSAPRYGDCLLFAEDTVRNLIDSMCVIVAPSTVGDCDPDHKHAGMKQSDGHALVGASADIITRYGELCNGTDTAHQAHSCAWVSVTYDTAVAGEERVWAQVGYMRIRWQSFFGYHDAYFTEFQGNKYDYNVYIGEPGPMDGSSHNYKLVADEYTGSWFAYCDNSLRETFQEIDPIWQTVRGDTVIWSGEILQPGSDMPGTVASPCEFSDCQIKTSNEGWLPARLDSLGLYHYNDPSEWWVGRIDATSFRIYDVQPH